MMTTGAHALAFHLSPSVNGNDAAVMVDLCSRGANTTPAGVNFNTVGGAFAFSVLFMDDADSANTVQNAGAELFHAISDGNNVSNINAAPTPNTTVIQSGVWLNFASQLFVGAGDFEAATGITFHFTQSWSGTIFIDNVHF